MNLQVELLKGPWGELQYEPIGWLFMIICSILHILYVLCATCHSLQCIRGAINASLEFARHCLGYFKNILYSYSTEDELLCQDGFANSKKYMWNNLPLDLKRSNSLSIFKNRLLNYHFENYITMCYKPNCYSCNTNQVCFNML